MGALLNRIKDNDTMEFKSAQQIRKEKEAKAKAAEQAAKAEEKARILAERKAQRKYDALRAATKRREAAQPKPPPKRLPGPVIVAPVLVTTKQVWNPATKEWVKVKVKL